MAKVIDLQARRGRRASAVEASPHRMAPLVPPSDAPVFAAESSPRRRFAGAELTAATLSREGMDVAVHDSPTIERMCELAAATANEGRRLVISDVRGLGAGKTEMMLRLDGQHHATTEQAQSALVVPYRSLQRDIETRAKGHGLDRPACLADALSRDPKINATSCFASLVRSPKEFRPTFIGIDEVDQCLAQLHPAGAKRAMLRVPGALERCFKLINEARLVYMGDATSLCEIQLTTLTEICCRDPKVRIAVIVGGRANV